ncbi:MAG: hypothetical protein U0V75_06390 [Ferruginibacter sp.]
MAKVVLPSRRKASDSAPEQCRFKMARKQKVATTFLQNFFFTGKTVKHQRCRKVCSIAITPDLNASGKMPEKYIWVNLPWILFMGGGSAIPLPLIRAGIICGKPETRTPLLNGAITDMITYPT